MAPKPELGKFLLYCFFRRDSWIRRYLPDTKRYSRDNLGQMLNRYSEVYVKPVAGAQGRGILKAWKRGGVFHVKKTTFPAKSFRSVADAHRYIQREANGRAFIAQQGIRLATVNHRPFDVRVMTQRRRPGAKWEYSAMLAKIAGPGSVVTNVALSRGTVMEVEQALHRSFGWDKARVKRCVNEMITLALRSAKHFDTYQHYRELGFDIAVDQNGRVWMLEQNTGPSHALFARLKSNLSLYRTIQFRWGEYARAIRRKRTG